MHEPCIISSAEPREFMQEAGERKISTMIDQMRNLRRNLHALG